MHDLTTCGEQVLSFQKIKIGATVTGQCHVLLTAAISDFVKNNNLVGPSILLRWSTVPHFKKFIRQGTKYHLVVSFFTRRSTILGI